MAFFVDPSLLADQSRAHRGRINLMDINLNVHVHFPDSVLGKLNEILAGLKTISQKVDHSMSVLSDKIASVQASVDTAIARVQADVAAKNKQIADLQALVDAGGATPADIAALETLKAGVDAIDPTNPAVLP